MFGTWQEENFHNEFNVYINDGAYRLNIWAKSTVIGLESRGFPVSCDDIISVEHTYIIYLYLYFLTDTMQLHLTIIRTCID